jgi:hypothetical protein
MLSLAYAVRGVYENIKSMKAKVSLWHLDRWLRIRFSPAM